MSLTNPHWYDYADRKKYYELDSKDDSELTKEERKFCIDMYHQEEFACGLDGLDY